MFGFRKLSNIMTPETLLCEYFHSIASYEINAWGVESVKDLLQNIQNSTLKRINTKKIDKSNFALNIRQNVALESHYQKVRQVSN